MHLKLLAGTFHAEEQRDSVGRAESAAEVGFSGVHAQAFPSGGHTSMVGRWLRGFTG